MVHLQVSKAGDALAANVGVLDRDIYKRYWNADCPQFIDEPACTVRIRVGQLQEGRDFWWVIDEEGAADKVAHSVAVHALPFLDRMHSSQAMEHFLESSRVRSRKYPPPIIYLALLKHDQGNLDGARTILAELGEAVTGEWRSRVREIATRIG